MKEPTGERVIFGGITQREELLKKSTGWNNGLSQDYDKKLGTWFADKPGAKQELREQFQQPVYYLTDDEIKTILMAHGFKISEGLTDLKPYVYIAVRDVLAAQKAKT